MLTIETPTVALLGAPPNEETLDEAIKIIAKALTRCQDRPSYHSAENACMATRVAWMSVYRLALFQENLLSEAKLTKLSQGFRACLARIEGIAMNGSANLEPQKARRLTESFPANIQLRIKMLNALISGGLAAVDPLMAEALRTTASEEWV